MSITAVTEILSRYGAPAQPISPPRFLGGAGGLSGARLWHYRGAQGPMVLRGWPLAGPSRQHIERVHHWLTMSTGLGFIPVPIRDRCGRSLQEHEGRLWEVAPWLPGTADRSRPPATFRVKNAFIGLATLHQHLAAERVLGPSHGLRERYESVTQLMRGDFERLETAIECSPRVDAPERVTARRWMHLARIVAPRLIPALGRASNHHLWIQPCLRDARAEHFLFENDRLSGLVDFGAMGVDTVVADLSRLIGDWLNDDPSARQIALESYEIIRPLDAIEAGLIAPFQSGTALLIGERWIRWHFVENRQFEVPDAVTEGIARSLGQLERLAFNGTGQEPLD